MTFGSLNAMGNKTKESWWWRDLSKQYRREEKEIVVWWKCI